MKLGWLVAVLALTVSAHSPKPRIVLPVCATITLNLNENQKKAVKESWKLAKHSWREHGVAIEDNDASNCDLVRYTQKDGMLAGVSNGKLSYVFVRSKNPGQEEIRSMAWATTHEIGHMNGLVHPDYDFGKYAKIGLDKQPIVDVMGRGVKCEYTNYLTCPLQERQKRCLELSSDTTSTYHKRLNMAKQEGPGFIMRFEQDYLQHNSDCRRDIDATLMDEK